MRDDYYVVIPNPARDMHVMRDTLGCARPGAPDARYFGVQGPLGPGLVLSCGKQDFPQEVSSRVVTNLQLQYDNN